MARYIADATPHYVLCDHDLLINSFKAFDHIWVMTSGGPGNSTSTLVTYIYAKVFDNVGLASAASFVLFIIVLLMTAIKSKFGKEGEVDA